MNGCWEQEEHNNVYIWEDQSFSNSPSVTPSRPLSVADMTSPLDCDFSGFDVFDQVPTTPGLPVRAKSDGNLDFSCIYTSGN